MPIQISDDSLTVPQRDRLRKILRAKSDADLNERLQSLLRAAWQEYMDMILGTGMPSRADEIRQNRLYHLLQYLYGGKNPRIPTEAEVSSLFQLTPSQSRTLIQSVLTRFNYSLESGLRNTLLSVLQPIPPLPLEKDGYYHVVIHSDTVLQDLNQIIADQKPKYDLIRKQRGTSRTYLISADSYNTLIDFLTRDRTGEQL